TSLLFSSNSFHWSETESVNTDHPLPKKTDKLTNKMILCVR
ncbi:unnamed protein product, partial [Callosobruchus maculatus]